MYPEWLAIQRQGSIRQIEAAIPLLITKVQNLGKTVFAYSERKLCAQDITMEQLASLNLSFEKALLPNTKLLPLSASQKAFFSDQKFIKDRHYSYF